MHIQLQDKYRKWHPTIGWNCFDKFIGPVLTLLAALAIGLLNNSAFKLASPAALLIFIVVFSAFRGGILIGLFSAAIASAFIAFDLSSPDQLFQYSSISLQRVLTWTLTMPSVAILVGLLKNREEKFFAREIKERQRSEDLLRISEERYKAIIEAAYDAFIVTNEKGIVIDWNRQAERTFGWSRKDILGQFLAETVIPKHYRQAYRNVLESFKENGLNLHSKRQLRLEGLHKNGHELPIEITIAPIKTERGYIFASFFRDITERFKSENIQSTQLQITSILVKSETFEEAVLEFLKVICENMHWEVGILWLVKNEEEFLNSEGIWHHSLSQNSEFVKTCKQIKFRSKEGLPGIVWASSEPCWTERLEEHETFYRKKEIIKEKFQSAAAFPVEVDGETVAVVEFFSKQMKKEDSQFLIFLQDAGYQIGQFLKRKTAESKLKQVLKAQDEMIARRSGDLIIANEALKNEIVVRTQIERQLSQSQRQLQLIMDAIPALITYVDVNESYCFVNQSYQRWFGYSKEQIVGRSIEDVIGEEAYKVVKPYIKKALQGETINIEAIIPYKDGGSRHVMVNYVPDFGDDGKVRGYMALVTDITTLKKAQNAAQFLVETTSTLASSLDYEQTLINVAELAIPRFADWCSVNLPVDGQLVQLAAAHKDPEKVKLVKEFGAKYPIKMDADHGSAKVFRTGKAEHLTQISFNFYERTISQPDFIKFVNSLGLTSYICVPLRTGKRVLGTMSFALAESHRVYDESDLKIAEDIARRAALAIEHAQLYKDLEVANRAKDAWIATVSHELRTPMNVIGGWISLLAEGLIEDREKKEVYQTLQRNVHAQNQLIEDLLDISSIITGKMKMEKKLLSIRSLVQDVVESMRLAANGKKLDLTLHAETPVEAILGDADRIRQVVFNLVSNGIKFTQCGGRVEVFLRKSSLSQIEILVSDNGIGIEAEFIPYVFDRLRQEDSQITRKFGGLGLGLAISQHIIEMHGGTISVTSEGKGKGASFSVKLPVAAIMNSEPFLNHQTSSPLSMPSVLAGAVLLLIDDEPDNLDMLSSTLKLFGAKVITASSAKEALHKLVIESPHFILSDIGMPEINGYEFIQKVRKLESEKGLAHVPALALTAYAGEMDRVQAIQAGFQYYMAKPVDSIKLVQIIDQAIALKNNERQNHLH